VQQLVSDDDHIDASLLALWLSWPSIVGEFDPASLNVDGMPLVGESSGRGGEYQNIRHALSASIEGCISTHEVIGVSLSGGLDSLAVLTEACKIARTDDRKIIAITAEMTDDQGKSNVPIIERLLADFGLQSDLHVSSTDQLPRGTVNWDRAGPRLDALPTVNLALSELAADAGCTLLLGGNGADEVLGTGRYLFRNLILNRKWKDVLSYWHDTVQTDLSALKHELLALGSPILPKQLRMLAYLASSSPELCRPTPPEVVGRRYRKPVQAWTQSWLNGLVDHHVRSNTSWASMEAWDAVFPLHRLPSAGPIPLVHPFLEESFLRAVESIPLVSRYNSDLAFAYWRQKALIVDLFPAALRPRLPHFKQTFRADLAHRFDLARREITVLTTTGILDSQAWHRESDPGVVHRVNAMNTWLDEAVRRGFTFD